jgi:integrase
MTQIMLDSHFKDRPMSKLITIDELSVKVSKGSVSQRADSPNLQLNISVNGNRHRFATKLNKYVKKNWDIAKKEVLPEFRSKILSGEIDLKKEVNYTKNFEYYSELYLKTKEKTVKPSTYKKYVNVVSMWNDIFKYREIKSIKPGEIKHIIYSYSIKGSSVKQYLSNLRGIFDEALDDEEILANPCERIKPPRDLAKEEIYPFEQDEVFRILESAGGWFANFLATGFYTGARVGELYALKWQNVDFRKKRIMIDSTRGDYIEGTTKTNSCRYVPLFDNLIPYLKHQKGLTGMKTYVFLTDKGKNLHPSNVREYMWKPLLRRLNIPYRTLYQTRHTFATTLLNSGKFSMNEVAKILGHSTVQMLIKHYNKFLEDEISKIDTSFDVFCHENCHAKLQTA